MFIVCSTTLPDKPPETSIHPPVLMMISRDIIFNSIMKL